MGTYCFRGSYLSLSSLHPAWIARAISDEFRVRGRNEPVTSAYSRLPLMMPCVDWESVYAHPQVTSSLKQRDPMRLEACVRGIAHARWLEMRRENLPVEIQSQIEDLAAAVCIPDSALSADAIRSVLMGALIQLTAREPLDDRSLIAKADYWAMCCEWVLREADAPERYSYLSYLLLAMRVSTAQTTKCE